jgi:hypothetical protein
VKLQIAGAALALGLCASCSHDIPPPVAYRASKTDDPTAKPNPANDNSDFHPPFGPYDVQVVFHIAKSNGGDPIAYGIRLDRHCTPSGHDPVFPYWRENRHPPKLGSHALRFFQYAAYGFSTQQTTRKSRSGGQHLIVLKQVKRPILIVTKQGRGGYCTATAYTRVKGKKNARLDYIFVKVAGMMSADYVDVHGTDTKTGEKLVERLTP